MTPIIFRAHLTLVQAYVWRTPYDPRQFVYIHVHETRVIDSAPNESGATFSIEYS